MKIKVVYLGKIINQLMLLKYLFLLIKYMVHKILNFKRKFKNVPAWRNDWVVTDFYKLLCL